MGRCPSRLVLVWRAAPDTAIRALHRSCAHRRAHRIPQCRTRYYTVPHLDDATMVRIYARENATQRGHTSTALTGSVASAVKFLMRAVMAGGVNNCSPPSKLMRFDDILTMEKG